MHEHSSRSPGERAPATKNSVACGTSRVSFQSGSGTAGSARVGDRRLRHWGPADSAQTGTIGIAVGAVAVLVLDMVTAWDDRNHLRQTISEYGLGTEQWIFSFGVILLAAGSAIVLRAMLRHAVVASSTSTAAMSMMIWIAGLTLVVAVPKQDWSIDPTIGLGGALHRIGAVVAFLAVPVAIIAAALPSIHDARWRTHARVTAALGALSSATLLPIFYALLVGMTTSTPWWRAVTLGYVERVLVVAEVIALISLGLWMCAVERNERTATRIRVPTTST